MQVRTGSQRYHPWRLLPCHRLTYRGVFRKAAKEFTTKPESLVIQVGDLEFRYQPQPPTKHVYDELSNKIIEIPGEESPCPSELRSVLKDLDTLRRISATQTFPQCMNDHVADYLVGTVTVTVHTAEVGQAVAEVLNAFKHDLAKTGCPVINAYKSLPPEMQTHDHVVMTVLENAKEYGCAFSCIPSGVLRANKRFVKQVIRNHSDMFRYVCPRFTCPTMYADKELILYFLHQLLQKLEYNRLGHVSWILSQISSPLLEDRDIAMAAVKSDGTSLRRFSHAVQNDRAVAYLAVTSSALALRDVLPTFREDVNLVLAAVQKFPTALRFAATHLRSDRHIVEKAIKKDGTTLLYASDELKNDFMLAEQAIRQNPTAYYYISDTLKQSATLVRLAATKCPQVLRSAPLDIRSNSKLMADIVRTHEVVDKLYENLQSPQYAFAYLPLVLQNDNDIAKMAVQAHGGALKHLPENFRNNEMFASWAIAQDPFAYRFIGDTLMQSRQLAIQTVRHPNVSFFFVVEDVIANWYHDNALVLEAASRSYPDPSWKNYALYLLCGTSDTRRFLQIKRDPKVVRALITTHGLPNLLYASQTLTNNIEFICGILADYQEFRGHNNNILSWIGDTLRQDMTTMLGVISKCTAPCVRKIHDSLRYSVEFWERLLAMELRVANRQSLIDDIPDNIKEDSRIVPLLSEKPYSDQVGSEVPATKKRRTM